jgi:lipopolysaccharide/colanic/teichoic acid biosynthesis glycosyltransferase
VRDELLADPESLAVWDDARLIEHPTGTTSGEMVLQGRRDAAVLAIAVVGHPDSLAAAERVVHTAEEAVVHVATEVEHALVALARRSIEVVVSLIGLVALVVLLPLLALAIRLDTRGPVFFRQTRLSRGGRPFTIYKLRTMTQDAESRLGDVIRLNIMDGPTFKAKDDPRITAVGRVLRRFSLDELPQFWNVLRGDMALVGPRPPLPTEWALYDPLERARLQVRPGITGLWQVSGRNHCPHQRMVELDLEYVRRRSLLLDLGIILRTLPSMLRGWGAY